MLKNGRTASRSAWLITFVGVVAVVAAIGLGTMLRLADPLSSPVIPAEDPYTHMAYVREHVHDGNLDPLNEGGNLYPPGLHAFLAATWIYTGADLADIVRFGPVVFGAVGVLGIALLLWRNVGPVAATVGALAYAMAPEVIFRTTMMAPTALDLALVPFLFIGLVETLRGRVAWSGVAAPIAAFLAIAHPWLFLLFGLMGLAFFVLVLVAPISRREDGAITPAGLAASIAVVAGGVGLASFTGPGFLGTLDLVPGISLPLPILALMVITPIILLPYLGLLYAPKRMERLLAWRPSGRKGLFLSVAVAALLAILVVQVTQRALVGGMPDLVDLPRMFGWPILVLGAVGLIAVPFIARPIGHLGAALTMATYPFVVFNPLDSPYWPHRTAVFLGIGLVILTGVAAGAAARLAVRGLQTWNERPVFGKVRLRPSVMAVLPTLLVLPVLGGGVYAGTPDGYPEGWYRLYEPCEEQAMASLAERVEDDPDAVVLTGTWQAKLVMAGYVPGADRLWYKPAFFTASSEREIQDRDDLVYNFQKEDRPLYVLVDRHLRTEHEGADSRFLDHPPWQGPVHYCEGLGGFAGSRTALYTLEVES
ncbi:MAG: hypothetical protein KY455_03265 [Euryarchaeota archaeon]|nr:hypothetical protein [Euryarchaeota archaeon]